MRITALICAMALLIPAAVLKAAPGEDEPLKVYARGDYAEAARLLEPAYQSGEAKIQERILLARAYLHLGRQEDALGVLQSALKIDRENPEANSLAGQILYKTGKHKEAVEYLKYAYRLKRDAANASLLGQCYYALGKTSDAKTHLEKALAEDIRNPQNSFVLGKICLERGAGALAEKYFLMAQEAGMESAELHLLLGRSYLLQQKAVGPILVRRITSAAKPGDIADGHIVLGGVAGVADQYKVCTRYSALYEGTRLLDADPQNADALFMLATGWLAAGQIPEAEKYLKTLSAREPDSRRVLDLKAQVFIAKKDFAALEKCLGTAEAKKVFDEQTVAEFYYRAALIQRAEGNRAAAIALLKKAEKRWPTSEKVLRSLAGLYVATGQEAKSRQYYARLVELFPDAADIDELQNALKVLKEKRGARK